ncbi:hypothetical protein OGAPHI_001840 [Ogataea philodendri]|uniref:Thioester reductase (TE) domain-containing protein n=1 Tax=Ogataea philodendri TaxID=1378263 RepID=A0A9P8T6R0_9ASCO|nr:uncharacterized protein OGAPHI_001840 [Ogataea philodendri]KAH3668086.1 hypothetical protein OGAPHI_001840 [Ogataea philodendri]
MSKLIVFGGSGFLGKRICQNAVGRGLDVVSVTSSGSKPRQLGPHEKWADKVEWTKGDVFKPHTYKHLLPDASGVVHSMGILLENQNYKKVVQSNDDLLGEIQSFFKTPNPMKKNVFNTYEKMNHESAIVLAETLIEVNKNKPAFAYISADRGFPGIPSGYIESKRKAEFELYQMQPNIRPILMRPGFMFDETNTTDTRTKLKNLLNVAGYANETILLHLLDGLIRPPISTQVVANWCVDRLLDPEFHGPVLLDEMIHHRGAKV